VQFLAAAYAEPLGFAARHMHSSLQPCSRRRCLALTENLHRTYQRTLACHLQRRELRHIKALSQAVLQQRSSIELFLVSSLELVRRCMHHHTSLQQMHL
jgi:hypothetical protein